MVRDEEHWCNLIDAFHSAAIGAESWHAALDGLARATGSWCGELIGVGAEAALPFNLMTNIDEEEFHEDFLNAGGPDPRFNPRVRAGLASPILDVLAECDFISPDEHRHHQHYELSRRWDVPYSCLATLDRSSDSLIGLAVLRSERQGHIEAEERRVFASLAPVVRAAVRTQIALAEQRAALLSGVMGAMTTAAFVSNHRGLVEPVTVEAEQLLNGDAPLRLKDGELRAATDADTKALGEAIRLAAADDRLQRPLMQTVPVRAGDAGHDLILDVIALPAQAQELASGPRVLILSRGRHAPRQNTAAVLQALYALTEAEADVAVGLSAGSTAEAIADRRCVAVGTVRAQTKSLLAKAGVKRQVDLVAQLGRMQLLS